MSHSHRQYKSVNHSSAFSSSIAVGQMNILADCNAHKEAFPAVDSCHLEWDARFHRIIQDLTDYNYTVFCLQEIDHFDEVLEELREYGYEGIEIKKATVEGREPRESMGIFWDDSKVEKISHHAQILVEGASQMVGIAIFRPIKAEMKRKLPRFAVACTHLKSKAENESLRISQAKSLVDILKADMSKAPLIICGDFNDTPDSETVKIVTDAGYQSAYDFVSPEAYTTAKFRNGKLEKRIIDYIFHSSDLIAGNRVELPEKVSPTGLPSEFRGSDHVYLCARLVIPDL